MKTDNTLETVHRVRESEWHLHNTGQRDGKPDIDCNILPAWSRTRGDPNITIAIIDNGFDLDHPGLRGANKYRDAYDAAKRQRTPSHQVKTGAHGTASAVLAVGSGHAATTRGTAPLCTFMPIRIDGRVGHSQEVRAFEHAFECGADVIACAWGALDGRSPEPWPLSSEFKNIVGRCVGEGRSGRGIPVLFAAGNGNEAVELDGYADNRDVICVSSVTNQGEKAAYSDYGRNVWVAAPSSGGTLDICLADKNHEAADQRRPEVFGSTSASVAMVAGIVGLMLSANPALDVGAVREILLRTARKTNSDRTPMAYRDYWGNSYDDGYDGLGHSRVYGWGRVDAGAAVECAVNTLAGNLTV